MKHCINSIVGFVVIDVVAVPDFVVDDVVPAFIDVVFVSAAEEEDLSQYFVQNICITLSTSIIIVNVTAVVVVITAVDVDVFE